MDRRLHRPPPSFRALLVLWLYQELEVTGWRSDILRPDLPRRVGVPQVLAATSPGARLLLLLGIDHLQQLRLSCRALLCILAALLRDVQRNSRRLGRLYLTP